MPLIVRWAEEIIYKEKADAIAACGHSGLVIAGALSYVTRLPVLAVRKKGEPVVAYTGGRVSAVINRKAERWVWLDDFLSSGGTFRNSAGYLFNEGVVTAPLPIASIEYQARADYFSEYGETGYQLDPDLKRHSELFGWPARLDKINRGNMQSAVPGFDWSTVPVGHVVKFYGRLD